jgi:hypothetical protein
MTYSPSSGLLRIADVANPAKYAHPTVPATAGLTTTASSNTHVLTLPAYQAGDVLVLTFTGSNLSGTLSSFGVNRAGWTYYGQSSPNTNNRTPTYGVTTTAATSTAHSVAWNGQGGSLLLMKKMPDTTETTITVVVPNTAIYLWAIYVIRADVSNPVLPTLPGFETDQSGYLHNAKNSITTPWTMANLPRPSAYASEPLPRTYFVTIVNSSNNTLTGTSLGGFGLTATVTALWPLHIHGLSTYAEAHYLVTAWGPDDGELGVLTSTIGANWNSKMVLINDLPAAAEMTSIPIVGDTYVDDMVIENITALKQTALIIAGGRLSTVAVDPYSEKHLPGTLLRDGQTVYVQQTDNGATPPRFTMLGRKVAA